MKQPVVLTITSLLSILLFTFHLSDEIVRRLEPGGFENVNGILILAVWLYGTLALGGRRSGYIVMLLGALLGSVVPLSHMRGGGTCRRQDRRLQRHAPLGLDAHRARHDRTGLGHPLGARTVEPAAGPVPTCHSIVTRNTTSPS